MYLNEHLHKLKKLIKYLALFAANVLALISIKVTYFHSAPVYHSHSSVSGFKEILELQSPEMTTSHIYTTIVLGIVTILALVKVRKWNYAFAVLCIVSMIRVGQLFVYTYSFGLGPAKIEVISMSLFLAHIIVNQEVALGLKQQFGLDKSNQKTNTVDAGLTNHYEQKYSELSDQELDAMLKNDQYVNEVKVGLSKIKENRNADKGA